MYFLKIKNFQKLRTCFYKWVKSQIYEPEHLYYQIRMFSQSDAKDVKLHITDPNSGWNETVEVIVVPCKILKLINNQF